MILRILLAMIVAAAAIPAYAHFVFVVPTEKEEALVVLSEDLQPDDQVDVEMVGPLKLFGRDESGKPVDLTLEKVKQIYEVTDIGRDCDVVYGTCTMGVSTRGDSKPFLLVYHPKTLVKTALETKKLDEAVPVELLVAGKPGEAKFQLIAAGKPLADSELTIILPDGKQVKDKTDAEGYSDVYKEAGRYGLWARYFEATAGEHDGKKYEEVRHYPTLVADLPAADGKLPKIAVSEAAKDPIECLAPMPEAVSSFGGVGSDGWVYIYGGHRSKTHSYDTDAVSGKFHRMKMSEGKSWEELPSGPGLQGMNLAAHGGKVYRIGGMQPRNKKGEETDNFSVDECAVYDPKAGKWEPIPSLPEPRSSHDVAVVGDKLYVIGGWNMLGKDGGEDWLDTMLVMDLAAEKPEWKALTQPFERRALIVSVLNDKVYVLGGFSEEEEPIKQLEIFDPAAETWSKGPNLPGRSINGFAPAACTLNGKLYGSVSDGRMYRLNEETQKWDRVARTTPRIVHRLVPDGDRILVLGGAWAMKNFDLVEIVEIEPTRADARASAE
jgi:hypothetical protein